MQVVSGFLSFPSFPRFNLLLVTGHKSTGPGGASTRNGNICGETRVFLVSVNTTHPSGRGLEGRGTSQPQGEGARGGEGGLPWAQPPWGKERGAGWAETCLTNSPFARPRRTPQGLTGAHFRAAPRGARPGSALRFRNRSFQGGPGGPPGASPCCPLSQHSGPWHGRGRFPGVFDGEQTPRREHDFPRALQSVSSRPAVT